MPTAKGPLPTQPSAKRVLLAMCVLIAVNQLGFGSMVPSMPLHAETFGVTASAIGMAVAVYGLARFVVALPAGQLSDWLGRRPTMAIGGLISGGGNLWCAYADAYPEFIVARFIAGFGAGLIVTTGQVVLTDISTPEVRGRMLAVYQGTFIFAVGIGPLPGGILAEQFGLEAPFVAAGLGSLGAGLVAWFAVPETRDFAENDQSRARVGAAPSLITQLRLLGGQLGYMLVCLVGFMNAFVRTGALFAIVPLFAASELNLSVGQIGIAMALGSFAGLAAAYPAGAIADRVGRKAVIVPVTLLTGVSMVLFCFAPGFLWFTIAFIVWGIATSAGGAAPAAYAGDSAPPGMNAAAIATFRMLGDAGYVIGPLFLGLMVDIGGPTAGLLVASGMIVAAGLAFAFWAPETHRGNVTSRA